MLQTFNFYEINFGKEDITANSYTQLFVHLIFVVEGRQSLITNSFKEKLNKYITGIIQQKKNKLIAINGMPDHLHILIGLNPDVSISALVQETKRCSTNYINENRFVIGRFSWQKGMLLFLIQNHLLVR